MILLSYARTAERPGARLWLQDDDGSLVDLSAATFELKIGRRARPALITKTSNITGAAGAGEEPDGTPNCVIAWDPGELNVRPGTYDLQLTARQLGALDRVWDGKIIIGDVIR